MSLIQEALKRQQMEQEGKLPPGGAAKDASPLKSTVVDGETFILPGAASEAEEPETPARLSLKRNTKATSGAAAETPETTAAERETESGTEPERKRISPMSAGADGSDRATHRVLPSLAAVIILLLLVAGALVWAVTYGLELAGFRMPWSKGGTVVAEKPVAGAPAVASAGDTDGGKGPKTPAKKPAAGKSDADAASPAKKPTIGSTVRQTVKDGNTATTHADGVISEASGEHTADTKPSAGAAAPATSKVPPPQDVPAAGQPATAVAATAPGDETAMAAIKWPDITISGVVGKEHAGAAFINNKVVGVNETIEGIRILAIKPQGALLEYKGETRLAKVGQPLNRATR
jgi:hypothetical protein